jgi:hypothetical protein
MKRLLLILAICIGCLGAPLGGYAQEETYKFDVGAQLGMSGYLGEANSNLLKHPGFSAGLSARYLINTRWTLRAVFNTLSLSGDTADYDNYYPNGEQYSFKGQAYDLGFRGECNFFAYGIGETYKKLRRWSPYLTIGIGFTLATCDGINSFAPNIPMGIGLKYKLSERWNLGAEFTMTKVFGDKVDGELTDLYQIKSSFAKNTDWYSNFCISITYEFGKRCVTCHYVD